MKRFNKLFAKRDKADEATSSGPIDYSNLSSCSNSDLCTLIYKYDEELKRLNPLLQSAKEDRDKATSDCQKRAEESKLYKEIADVRVIQSLQEQFTSVSTELRDLREVLQSKKAEVELLRSQMMTMEEMNAAVKRELAEYEGKVMELEGKLRGGNAVADESLDLSKLTAVSLKHEQRVKELEIIKKTLEAEVMRLARLNESASEELKSTKEKLSEMHTKASTIAACKQEAAGFAFLKESLENEIKALKEINAKKEEMITKGKEKTKVLKEELREVKDEIEKVKGCGETERNRLKKEVEMLTEELRETVAKHEITSKAISERQESEIQAKSQEIEELKASLQITKDTCDLRELKIASLEESVSTLQRTLSSHESQLTSHSSEVQQLKLQLEEAQKRREQARLEVIKLSQRLEQRTPLKEESQKPQNVFFPGPVTADPADGRMLERVKAEVDGVYKALMKAMLTAKDVPYPSDDLTSDSPGLLMQLSLFSLAERQLNNLQMSLLELTESIEPLSDPLLVTTTPQSWSGRITSAMANIKQTVRSVGPVKLFSCMPTGKEKQRTKNMEMKPKTDQGRKMMSHTGGSLPLGPNDSSDSIPRRRL